MRVSTSWFVVAAGCATLAAVASVPLPAQAQGSISLKAMQPPSLAWGQRGQFITLVAQNGRPVKNVTVEFWFSGRHGMRTGSWHAKTNNEGRATFTQTLPRDWAFKDTWADLNGSCNAVGAFNLWRVKNK